MDIKFLASAVKALLIDKPLCLFFFRKVQGFECFWRAPVFQFK